MALYPSGESKNLPIINQREIENFRGRRSVLRAAEEKPSWEKIAPLVKNVEESLYAD